MTDLLDIAKGMIKEGQKEDEKNYKLYLRSTGQKASKELWSDPYDADGVPILARKKKGTIVPTKTAHDLFSKIMNNKGGYLKYINREYAYSSEEDDESRAKKTYLVPDDVRESYRLFDIVNSTEKIYKNNMAKCAGWGDTYTLLSLADPDDSHPSIPRIKEVNSWNAKLLKDGKTGDTRLGVIYYDKALFIYDETDVYIYEKNSNEYVMKDTVAHGFKHVPLIQWRNNEENRGNAERSVPLMDAYDGIISDGATEIKSFANAYIVLKNSGKIDEDTRKLMVETGILPLEGEGASAEFLTRQINPAFIQFMSDNIWSAIFSTASSFNPKALGQISNSTAYQIRMFFKDMEDDMNFTTLEWLDSLRYQDKLLESYWTGLASPSTESYDTTDISYQFVYNIPENLLVDLEVAQRAGIQLTNATKIRYGLPFIEDPDAESEKALGEAEAAVPNYNFGFNDEDNTEQ